jgi:hypothetical protein
MLHLKATLRLSCTNSHTSLSTSYSHHFDLYGSSEELMAWWIASCFTRMSTMQRTGSTMKHSRTHEGGTSKPLNISFDGEVFAVIENVHAALEYLRNEDEDRTLWIDAVCINQDDPKERGHQVQQMESIYEYARQVIVWLGTAATGTDFLFDSIRALERQALGHACNDWSSADTKWQSLLVTAMLDQVHDGRKRLRLYSCFDELLRRDWFQRVCVLQEVAKARAAKVVCGSRSVSARFFALTPPLLCVVPEPHCRSVINVLPGPSRRYSWLTKSRNLLTLSQRLSSSQASDQRDNIYALLGIHVWLSCA